MTIKEKAKAYDKALEIAKKWYYAPNADKMPTYANRIIKEIFPELKESEDERIRKELLEHCKNQAKPYIQTRNKCPQIQSWIAWLEKQSQTFTKKDVDDAYLKGISDAKNELEKQGEQKPVIDFKAKNWYVSKVDGQIHDMTYNPTNKVEPNKKNNMKVFGCNAQLPYSGGGILVAANDLDEAIRVAAEEYRLLFDCYKKSKDIVVFAKPNEADFIESDWYPKNKWKEITELTCNCDKPHVIIENGYEA